MRRIIFITLLFISTLLTASEPCGPLFMSLSPLEKYKAIMQKMVDEGILSLDDLKTLARVSTKDEILTMPRPYIDTDRMEKLVIYEKYSEILEKLKDRGVFGGHGVEDFREVLLSIISNVSSVIPSGQRGISPSSSGEDSSLTARNDEVADDEVRVGNEVVLNGRIWKVDDGIERTWDKATDYCRSLENNFRLATRGELEDAHKDGIWNIKDELNLNNYYYWSSESTIGDDDRAYIMRLDHGILNTSGKTWGYRVLCVRP